jgi:hypothetical protein
MTAKIGASMARNAQDAKVSLVEMAKSNDTMGWNEARRASYRCVA